MAEALDPAIPPGIDELAQRVLGEAGRRNLKLVTAESCTGGLLASLLTDIPGASHVFERGFVVYTNRAKQEMLGVSPALLDSPGPVSEEVARAMAEGALRHSRGDISLAITGFADGAPGSEGAAGLVHFAAARRGGPTRHRCESFGPQGRGRVRLLSLETSLKLMWQSLSGQP